MIKIKGVGFRTVELPDIGDRIYYGQEKVYSEQQYKASRDLYDAIQDGRLLILEGSEEIPQHFIPPKKETSEKVVVKEVVKEVIKEVVKEVVKEEPPVVEPPTETEDSETIRLLNESISQLNQQVQDLTKQVQEAPDTATSDKALELILNKMNHIEENIGQKETPGIAEQLGRVEKTLKGLSVSGEGVRTTTVSESTDMGETYVPSNFNVTDMNSNVELETKSVKGNNMQEALKKLNNLKKKSK